jgi:hypothetical protein
MSFETKSDELLFLWVGITGGGFGIYTVDFFGSREKGMECVRDAAYSIPSK